MSLPLKITRVIDNHLWKITFSLNAVKLPENDAQLMMKFGEPQISIGGVFLEGTPDEYTLPEKFIRVKTDLPFTQTFDAQSSVFSTNLLEKAEAFQEAFVTAYTEAFSDLRALNDNFSGEFIVNI